MKRLILLLAVALGFAPSASALPIMECIAQGVDVHYCLNPDVISIQCEEIWEGQNFCRVYMRNGDERTVPRRGGGGTYCDRHPEDPACDGPPGPDPPVVVEPSPPPEDPCPTVGASTASGGLLVAIELPDGCTPPSPVPPNSAPSTGLGLSSNCSGMSQAVNPTSAGGRGGAASAMIDFLSNYRRMRDAKFTGSDKYFHCMANCEGSRQGFGGAFTSGMISEAREMFDEHVKGDTKWQCDDDRVANDMGRRGDRNRACSEVCSVFRPFGF